jgi:hypothetical protein
MDSQNKELFLNNNLYKVKPTTISVTTETIYKREKDFLYPNPKRDSQTISWRPNLFQILLAFSHLLDNDNHFQ